jgi:hypothetical protein
MLANKTVLILGAGASVESGLPIGSVLLATVRNLCHEVRSNPNQRQFASYLSPDLADQAAVLETCIDESPMQSIDLLLQYRHDLMGVGKLAIAYCLLPWESHGNLAKADRRNTDWYPYLFEAMRTEGLDDFFSNPITIVTFNYDRSIDAFFRRSLCSIYNKQVDEIERQMPGFRIIHLHGQLGSLQENPYGCCANGKFKQTAVPIAANSIKIIHEVGDPDNDSDFLAARAAINAAEAIIILGFGFNKENVGRLQINKSHAQIWSSGYGLTESEKTSYNRLVGRSIVWGQENDSIRRFLREQGCLSAK